MAEGGVVAVREGDRLKGTIKVLEMKVKEMEGSYNELSMMKVRGQYLGQQVQVLTQGAQEKKTGPVSPLCFLRHYYDLGLIFTLPPRLE